ncbi:hypothetical protein EPJ64_03080 [Brachyspira aalborgi]|jgi:hypothetical protein|uniref:Uncharacterized protein n=1 Tax=Brachyspira aalborgi TaxID=29522 RepID=A0A5C8G726_9SPIR|nr:hypothetical protein [Brachyspira aalborgi]TXJ16388.1 hypothetical protein EPJ77_03085 [Brachyspira aalborgi]TXJ21969.1 hypothetical protein EPJ64_03080 [Brachyspira aalborgi]TXJ27856.1 hypothetical protein EPJ73_02400 [Brachyspira aalborgi]TXJ46745.1 hypothetical protein EPJ70_00980 [Brachyspira aalborgi]TXJ49969.1 hypothetical protein EPJ75_03360 [Brachyspira aalborgi]
MKRISNIFKVLIVIFIMYQYHRLSSLGALSSDSCKGLLFIGISCFFVLCPVDASIFAKNIMILKGKDNKIKQSEGESKNGNA